MLYITVEYLSRHGTKKKKKKPNSFYVQCIELTTTISTAWRSNLRFLVFLVQSRILPQSENIIAVLGETAECLQSNAGQVRNVHTCSQSKRLSLLNPRYRKAQQKNERDVTESGSLTWIQLRLSFGRNFVPGSDFRIRRPLFGTNWEENGPRFRGGDNKRPRLPAL